MAGRTSWRDTWKVWSFGLAKVPLIFFVRPRVEELSESRCVVRIPLRYRTKNHLGSMYFGTLCVGADVAGGLMALRQIEQAGGGMSLIFGEIRGEFLKRVEADALFSCEDGLAIAGLVAHARASGERESLPVTITVTVPEKLGEEPAARFLLNLSVKRKA
jgi:acyl-coenzyme A thioesterase PaaI-like protein